MYKKGSSDSSESEEDQDETDNQILRRPFTNLWQKQLLQGRDSHQIMMTTKVFQENLHGIWRLAKKSTSVERLYQALLTISPTSVAYERMFSISGWLLNQQHWMI